MVFVMLAKVANTVSVFDFTSSDWVDTNITVDSDIVANIGVG